MSIYKFLEVGDEINTGLRSVVPQNVSDQPPKYNPTEEKQNSFFELFKKDNESIGKLTSNLKETITFYNKNNLLPVNLPAEINIKYSNKYKIEQKINSFKEKFSPRQDFGRVNPNHVPEIRLPVDLVKNFNPNDLENDNSFFGILRQKIVSPILEKNKLNNTEEKTSEEVNKVITDIVFSHELSHIILFVNYQRTFLHYIQLAHSVKKEDKSPIQQIATNITEGFADYLGSYLTQIKNPDIDFMQRYEAVRNTQVDIFKPNKNYIVQPYDVMSLLNKQLQQPKDISELINTSLIMATKNTLNLSLSKLQKEPTFKILLEEDLKDLLGNNFKYKSNEHCILRLEEMLNEEFKGKNNYLDKEVSISNFLSMRYKYMSSQQLENKNKIN